MSLWRKPLEESVKPEHLAKEILAFANSDGGTILIGVDDRGGITGVTRKGMEEWLVNICRNNCHPSLIPIIETVKL